MRSPYYLLIGLFTTRRNRLDSLLYMADSGLSGQNFSQSLHHRHRPLPGATRHRREHRYDPEFDAVFALNKREEAQNGRWWLGERRLGRIGWSPKRRYLFGTALLFAVILVNPIVGLIGYVGSHALEYFVIVHGALGRRYSGPMAQPGGVVGRVVRSPLRASGCVVVYVVLVGIGLVSVQKLMDADIGNTVLLTVGGMHVFFDGFIWKLRRPVVAHSVAAD